MHSDRESHKVLEIPENHVEHAESEKNVADNAVLGYHISRLYIFFKRSQEKRNSGVLLQYLAGARGSQSNFSKYPTACKGQYQC